jgi:rare lipoprotein A
MRWPDNNFLKETIMLKLLPFILTVMVLAGCAETQFGAHVAKSVMKDDQSKGTYKVGNPYLIDGQEYYPQENFDYVETGIASWYGPGFHAKQTANGEFFDQNELTAAHRTLQMPSLVRVTNLDNGRAVVLRVNDRGPFSRGRIIDVSSKAADLLGFKSKGTAKVRVETLPNESRRIAQDARAGIDTRGYEIALNGNVRPTDPTQSVTYYPSPSAVSVSTQGAADTMQAARVASVESVSLSPSRIEPVQGHISNDGRFLPDPIVTRTASQQTKTFIQAGAFSNEGNAQALANRLGSIGQARVTPANIAGNSFYRVRLGPFQTIEQADAALQKILTGGTNNAMIVVE